MSAGVSFLKNPAIRKVNTSWEKYGWGKPTRKFINFFLPKTTAVKMKNTSNFTYDDDDDDYDGRCWRLSR